jgi:hypothetical protein
MARGKNPALIANRSTVMRHSRHFTQSENLPMRLPSTWESDFLSQNWGE